MAESEVEEQEESVDPPLTIPNVQDGLQYYYDQIRKFPMLDPDEEFMLAKRWQEHQDPKAAEKLITSHLRLVAKIASGYKGYGLPVADVIAEGNVGLMRAVGKFDPDKGFRFSTYAMWWIKASIQDYILHSWSLVKIGTTAAQKKLFFNLRRMRNELNEEAGFLSQSSVESIAKELDVSEKEVIEMNKRLTYGDASLNATLNSTSQDEWQDWLVDEGLNQEDERVTHSDSQVKNALLHKALQSLNPREAMVIHARRLINSPKSLDDLSQEMGLSREGVRQIELKAFDKLQKYVKSSATQMRLEGQSGRQSH